MVLLSLGVIRAGGGWVALTGPGFENIFEVRCFDRTHPVHCWSVVFLLLLSIDVIYMALNNRGKGGQGHAQPEEERPNVRSSSPATMIGETASSGIRPSNELALRAYFLAGEIKFVPFRSVAQRASTSDGFHLHSAQQSTPGISSDILQPCLSTACVSVRIIYRDHWRIRLDSHTNMPTRAASQHEALQPLSSLLQLPAELRNQILRYLVTQPEPITLYNPDSPFTINVNILYTCRQLRTEATWFLLHKNVFEIAIDSRGPVVSLLFSKYHSVCEYRADEAVAEVSTLFLDRFSHFQFRLPNNRRPDSLRRTMKRIEQGLNNKHVTVVLPPRSLAQSLVPPSATRSRNYPHIDNPLSPFSALRCASFNVLDGIASLANAQFGVLIDLVRSDRPPIDMAQRYHDLQRSARAVDRMLPPSSELVEEFGLLHTALVEHVWEACQAANKSDQDAFIMSCERFEDCYRQIQDL